MGIRLLNKYLRENAKESIKITHLSELSGKKIAIDICMTIYGLEWALSDQGSSDISSQDVIKTFIDRHFNSYSIYYY